MSLRTVKVLDSALLARLGAFDKDENVSIVLPEDLATLSDAELEQLSADAKAAFNELREQGNLNADKVAVLRDLKAAVGALGGEKSKRDTDADTLAAEVAALSAEVNATAEVDAAEDAADVEVEVTDEAVAEVVAAAEAVTEDAVAPVVASGPVHPLSISVPQLRSRQTPVVVNEDARSPFRAAVNVPGLEAGADLDLDAISEAFARMTDSARVGPVEAAQRAGTRFSQTHGVAHIVKTFDPRAVVGEDNDADAAIKFATDQKNLKGGSLVAAGGWCAPSETVYDLCQPESTDGILSVPEIQVRRGGLRFTQGPDWVDIFAGTGFCFDEADDIGGLYSTNEQQTVTLTGTTAYSLAFGGQNTASLTPTFTAAQLQTALQGLSSIGPNNVIVSGANGGPLTVQFVNALGNTDVAQLTVNSSTGTAPVIATTVAGGGVAGSKPNNIVPCPSFTDVRLNVCGVQIQSGILLNRAYPEVVKRYVSGSLVAHAHRVATNVLASMINQATAVSPSGLLPDTTTNQPASSAILSAIELQAEDIKYKRRLPRATTLEAIFPFWVRGVIRADLSRRLGLANPFDVSDAQIDAWFRARGINAQFIYNFDNLGGPTNALAWPTTVRFLIYPAGTYVKGASDLITLSMLHDSTLNANNNFTAIFTEEAWSVMKLCHESRIVTVPICPNGRANSGVSINCS